MPHRHHDSKKSVDIHAGFANPFCVLALSADADGSSIQQAAQRALMERRLGGQGASTAREVDLIESALEQLKDPVTRFHASLYWVTLNQVESSAWGAIPHTRSFAFDITLLAQDCYEKIAAVESVAVRTHNLAVLYCADAHRLASMGDLEAAAESWAHGYGRWSLSLSSEEFAKRLHARARLIDDPRLSLPIIREEIKSIPRRLLARPATLAALALEERRTHEAIALVKLIRKAPFDSEYIDQALEIVYRPLAIKVEQEIDAIDKQRQHFVEFAEDYAASGRITDLLKEFKSEVAPDLDQMLELGDLPGLAEEHARDHASRFLQQLGLDAWNIAENASLAQEITRFAHHYADARSLKDKLKNSLSQLADQEVLSGEIDKVMELVKSSQIHEAINRLKQLRGKVQSAESQEFLDTLIERVSDNHAGALFGQAMAVVERGGNPITVRRLLEESRSFACDPEFKATIDRFLGQVRGLESRIAAKQSTGCLIPLVVGIGVLGLPLILRGLMA